MANPSARERLIMDIVLTAASKLPLSYARSAPVESALTSVGIPFIPQDASWGSIPAGDALETLARALEASRLSANHTFIDALFLGERHRQEIALDAQAAAATATAAARSAEADAIAAVVF